MNFDQSAVVLASEADDTWQISSSRIRLVPDLVKFKNANWHPPYHLPWGDCKDYLTHTLGNALEDISPGDVVWIHNRPDFASALSSFAQERNVRLVLHLQNSHLVHFPAIIVRSIAADAYIFASTFLKEEATLMIPTSALTRIIPNGANPKIFYPLEHTANEICTVLFVGRLVGVKGLHIFIEAMRSLEKRGIRLKGLVVGAAGFGQGKTSRYMEEMIRIAPKCVEFLGYCIGNELGQIYRDSDIFCFPSIWQEPFGMVAVEAMASGLPLVASHCGGIPEILEEGGGLLIPPNSVEALTDALTMLGNDTDRRRKMGDTAYRVFRRRFTWEVIYREYKNFVKQLEVKRR